MFWLLIWAAVSSGVILVVVAVMALYGHHEYIREMARRDAQSAASAERPQPQMNLRGLDLKSRFQVGTYVREFRRVYTDLVVNAKARRK